MRILLHQKRIHHIQALAFLTCVRGALYIKRGYFFIKRGYFYIKCGYIPCPLCFLSFLYIKTGYFFGVLLSKNRDLYIKRGYFVHQKRILRTSKEDTFSSKEDTVYIKRGYFSKGSLRGSFKRASRENHVRMPEPPRCGRAARSSVRVAVFVVPNSRWPCKRVMASVLAHPRSSSVEVPGFIVQLSRK